MITSSTSSKNLEFPKPAQPVFVRLPKPGGRCPYTGLSRSTLCERNVPSEANAFKPPVPSHLVKEPSATRGVRLIHLSLILRYLGSLQAGSGGAAIRASRGPGAPLAERSCRGTTVEPAEAGEKYSTRWSNGLCHPLFSSREV